MEYDEPGGPITHGRFHTMTGYNLINQMTPSDVDLFATLTMLTERHGIDYGILHTCTLDSMGHRFGHDCIEMDHAVYAMDGMLAAFLPRWLRHGYEVMVTADHGQTDRGHHGGHDDEMQDFALYYFGKGKGPKADALLDQLQLAPTDPEAAWRAGARDDEGKAVSGTSQTGLRYINQSPVSPEAVARRPSDDQLAPSS